MTIIYHNPRCRKSHEALRILQESGEPLEIVEYLKEPPSVAQIKDFVENSGQPVKNFIRRQEQEFKDHFRGKDLSDEEWCQALHDFPKMMERPVVVKGKKTVLGRPPENVKNIL